MQYVTSTEQLSTGDAVTVTVDGRDHTMVVSRIYTDPSIGAANARTATVSLGPGRWSFEVRNDTLDKYKVRKPEVPAHDADPMNHAGPVFGLWWGGSSYGPGELATDGERFDSIDAAKSALIARYHDGYSFRQTFNYINREPVDVLCPAVSEDCEIVLVLALPEDGDFSDVYPDLRITLKVDSDGEASAHVDDDC